MLSALNTTQKGILASFIGFGGFACADTCSKWLGQHYDVFNILFWTYLSTLILGLIVSRWLGGLKKTLKTPKPHIHIARGLTSLGIALGAVTALTQGLPLANLYTILFLSPFIITIAAWPIYNEPVPLRNWLIIALGFSGVLIAFRPGFETLPPTIFYALGALLCIVTNALLSRPLDARESLHSLSFYPAIVTLITFLLFIRPDLQLPNIEHVPIFILASFFVLCGLSGIAQGYRLAPHATVAPIHYSQMVIAIGAGYFVFGDVPTLWMLIGASIIILSGIILILNKKNRAPKPYK